MCLAASRVIVSPSHKAETSSAASSHFMHPPLSLWALLAIPFSPLPAPQTAAIAQFQPVSPKSRLARRTIAPRLLAARLVPVALLAVARKRRRRAKPFLPYIRQAHSTQRYSVRPAFATILQRAFSRLRKDRRAVFLVRAPTHCGVAKAA